MMDTITTEVCSISEVGISGSHFDLIIMGLLPSGVRFDANTMNSKYSLNLLEQKFYEMVETFLSLMHLKFIDALHTYLAGWQSWC